MVFRTQRSNASCAAQGAHRLGPYATRLAILLLCFANGCGDSGSHPSSSGGQSNDDVVASRSSPRDASENSTEPEAAENGDDRVQEPEPAPHSTHPIDQVPEGKSYRVAVDALDNGDRKTAEEIRERLSGHPQFDVLARAIYANELVYQGKYDGALALAEQISQIPVARAEAYVIGGNVFRQTGRWSQAIGAFRSALDLHPENVRAHRFLSVVYHDMGAMSLATQHLRQVAALDPDDYRVLRLSGRIHHDYQAFEEAAVDFRRALQRRPPAELETELRIQLADSLRELRKLDEALEVLEPCPDTVRVLTTRAACWEALGETDRAEEFSQRALAIDSTDPEANFVHGRVLFAQRSFSEAVEVLRQAVEARPSDHESRYYLGRAMVQAGESEAGRAQLEEAQRLKDLFLEMAELHLEAVDKPNDAGIRYQLGELAEATGREQIAKFWYRAAISIDPELSAAQAAIDRLSSDSSEQ